MAKAKPKPRNRKRMQEIAGIILLFLAVACVMSLVSYDVGDETWFNRQPEDEPRSNWGGWAGATLGEVLLQVLGTSSWLVPVFLAMTGWICFRRRLDQITAGPVLSLTALTLFLATLTDLLFVTIEWGGEHQFKAGGVLGQLLGRFLVMLFNRPGAIILSATVVAAIVVLLTKMSFSRLLDFTAGGALFLWKAVRGLLSDSIPPEKRGGSRPAPVIDRDGEPLQDTGPRKSIPYKPESQRVEDDTPPRSPDELLNQGAHPSGGVQQVTAVKKGASTSQSRQADLPLTAPPVQGGISAAGGRVYVVATDGTITCFGIKR